jgi:hypothetical protein
MFLKLKPNREIRLLADLVPYNKITVKDHETIANQAHILRTQGRAEYRFTIDCTDWDFQINV